MCEVSEMHIQAVIASSPEYFKDLGAQGAFIHQAFSQQMPKKSRSVV